MVDKASAKRQYGRHTGGTKEAKSFGREESSGDEGSGGMVEGRNSQTRQISDMDLKSGSSEEV